MPDFADEIFTNKKCENSLDFYPVEGTLVFFYIMATNKKHTDIQKGEVVQAVVIADSFDSKFGPLTTTRPRVSKTTFRSKNFKILCALSYYYSVFYNLPIDLY